MVSARHWAGRDGCPRGWGQHGGLKGQDTGAPGDGESGGGHQHPFRGHVTAVQGMGYVRGQGTGQGMGYPRGQGCSRALGTAGQPPTSFQGTEGSRRECGVPLGTEGQGPSKRWGTVGWEPGSLQGRGDTGLGMGWSGDSRTGTEALQGSRRWQQSQVQPDSFSLLPRPFVPQFCSRVGMGSGVRTHILSIHPPHPPFSPAPTHATSTSPSSRLWGSSWPLSS